MALVPHTATASNVRWSQLLAETSKAMASSNVDLRPLKQLLDKSFDLRKDTFAWDPLAQLPPIPLSSTVGLTETDQLLADEGRILQEQVKALYTDEEAAASNISEQYILSLLKLAEPTEETSFAHELSQFHGSRLSIFPAQRSSPSVQGLCLVLRERQAVLDTLELIVNSESLSDFRMSLVEKGLIGKCAKRVLALSKMITTILSVDGQRSSLRPALQLGALLRERYSLSRLCFLLCGYGVMAESEFKLMVDLCRELSRDQLFNSGRYAHASTVSSMVGPLERANEWMVAEKSHSLEVLIHISLACASQMLEHNVSLPTDRSVFQSSESWAHQGFSGFFAMCSAFSPGTSDREQQRALLKNAFDSRALAFFRCLLRCNELRFEDSEFVHRLLRIAGTILEGPITWVSDFNARSVDYYLDDNDGAASSVNLFLVSRADERSKSTNSDTLEDLMECIISVATLRRDHEYIASFFRASNERTFAFLGHCSKVAERRSFYNFVSALVSSGEPNELFTSSAGFLGRRFVEDTVTILQRFREGLIPEAGLGDIRAQIDTLSTLFSVAPDAEKVNLANQLLVISGDFVPLCFTLIAHPAIAHEPLKVTVLRLLASLAAFPFTPVAEDIAAHWRRFFSFGGENTPVNEPRLDVRAYLVQKENPNHSFPFTLALLQLAQSLVVLRNDSADLVPLIQFVIGDVFFAYDQRVYSHPGEKWLMCAEALRVLLLAIETCEDKAGAGYMVLGYLMRETSLFAKLIDVLEQVGFGKGAQGLVDCVRNAKRFPAVDNAQGVRSSHRLDWFSATSQSTNLGSVPDSTLALPRQYQLVPQATSFGSMLHATRGVQQLERLVSGGAVSNPVDLPTQNAIKGWLSQSKPLPIEEPPFLWDDGDPSCEGRIESARLVLRILVVILERQSKFFMWQRTQTSGVVSVKIQTLLLSQPQVFVKAVAGYVGFTLDSECRESSLLVLDEIASAAPNREHQVFDFVSPSSFLFSMNQGSDAQERDRMFEFLCKHRPTRILVESAHSLTRLIAESVEDSKTMSDAIRTLGLIANDESARKNVAQIPHDFPERSVSRYLSFVNRLASVKFVPKEVFMGLSWTLRLLHSGQFNAGFLFHKQHEPNALIEILLGMFARGVDAFPEQATHYIQSWRLIVEANLGLVEDPLGLTIALMDCITSSTRATPETLTILTKASLVLVRMLFSPDSLALIPQSVALSSREEIFALTSRCADAIIRSHIARNMEAFGYSLSALLKVLNGLQRARQVKIVDVLSAKRLLESAKLNDFDRVSIAACFDALGSQSRADIIMEACALVCMDRQSITILRSVSAMAFGQLVFFSHNFEYWIEQATRRGVFQGIIAASVDRALEAAPKEGASLEWIEAKLADASFEPVLAALERVARFKDGAAVLADNLSVLWKNQSPLLVDRANPLRFMVDQNIELSKKRARVVLPVLALIAAVVPTEVRFGLRFLRNYKSAVVSSLSSFNSDSDLQEAKLIVSILALCGRFSEAFTAEFPVADEAVFTGAVVGALCGCINRVKGLDTRAVLTRTSEVRLISACLVYLTTRSSAVGTVQTLESRKREEMSALVMFIPMLVEGLSLDRVDTQSIQTDLERCLFLILDRMSRKWSGKDDMKDLRVLFPQTVSGAANPSALERFAETGKANGTYINLLCTRLCELRFR